MKYVHVCIIQYILYIIRNCEDVFDAIQLIRYDIQGTRTWRKLDVGGKNCKSRGNWITLLHIIFFCLSARNNNGREERSFAKLKQRNPPEDIACILYIMKKLVVLFFEQFFKHSRYNITLYWTLCYTRGKTKDPSAAQRWDVRLIIYDISVVQPCA